MCDEREREMVTFLRAAVEGGGGDQSLAAAGSRFLIGCCEERALHSSRPPCRSCCRVPSFHVLSFQSIDAHCHGHKLIVELLLPHLTLTAASLRRASAPFRSIAVRATRTISGGIRCRRRLLGAAVVLRIRGQMGCVHEEVQCDWRGFALRHKKLTVLHLGSCISDEAGDKPRTPPERFVRP